MLNIIKASNEYRCVCGRLQFKGVIAMGNVQVKCSRCHRILDFNSPASETLPGAHTLVFNEDADLIYYSKDAPIALGYTEEEAKDLKAKDIDIFRRPQLIKEFLRILAESNDIENETYVTNAIIKTKSGKIVPTISQITLVKINNELFVINQFRIVNQIAADTGSKDDISETDYDLCISKDGIIEAAKEGVLGYSKSELIDADLGILFAKTKEYEAVLHELLKTTSFVVRTELQDTNGNSRLYYISFTDHSDVKTKHKSDYSVMLLESGK